MKLFKKAHAWCNRHEWLILFLGLVIIFRLPTLFTPHYYGDEEIYFVMGKAWRDGVPLYQAMFDHKPPLIYILAGIARTVFWFRFMLLAAMVAHTWLFYVFAKKFWAKIRPNMAYLSTAIFVVLTTLPTFEGNIANAELFMMVPLTAAVLLVWDARSNDWKRFLGAGLIAGIGWLFKVPVAADFAALALYFFPFQETTFLKSIRSLFTFSFWSFVIGFALPLLSTFVYYYLKGTGPAYLATVLTVNLGYVSSWSTSTFAFNPFKSGLLVRAMIAAGVALFLYLFRKKLDTRFTFVSLWLAFSFFGSLLSGRPYPHYLQEPFVPLSLFVPFIFTIETFLPWVVVGGLTLWALLTNKQIKFWAYDTLPLYKNFAAAATGKISYPEYVKTFDGAKRNYAIGEYLIKHMDPADKIFVWGSDAALYNITDRLPSGGKYMVNFHILDFHAENYVMEELTKNDPRYIIVLPNSPPFPALKELLDTTYVDTYRLEGATVYLRFPEK